MKVHLDNDFARMILQIKVGLSSSKKAVFISFVENPLKMT